MVSRSGISAGVSLVEDEIPNRSHRYCDEVELDTHDASEERFDIWPVSAQCLSCT